MTTATSELPESELPLHFEKRLEFETLLADLAVRFVNAPAEQMDPEIEHAQSTICDSSGFDASTIWQRSLEGAGVFHLSQKGSRWWDINVRWIRRGSGMPGAAEEG